MQQLSGVDASFLYMERGRTSGTCAASRCSTRRRAAEPLTLEGVQAVVAERLHLLPPLRRRLVEVPLGHRPAVLGRRPGLRPRLPRARARAARAGHARAARRAGRAHRVPAAGPVPAAVGALPGRRARERPRGADGEVPPRGDRRGGRRRADHDAARPDPRAAGRPRPRRPWRARPLPSDLQMWLRGVAGAVAAAAAGAGVPAPAARDAAGLGPLPRPLGAVRADGDAAAVGGRLATATTAACWPGRRRYAPRTSFNRPITPHRRWAYGTSSLSAVKEIKNAFGVTVNDVVMAACAGGLRRWLEAHGELPGQPLLAMVPISMRTRRSAASSATGCPRSSRRCRRTSPTRSTGSAPRTRR